MDSITELGACTPIGTSVLVMISALHANQETRSCRRTSGEFT